MLRSSTPVVDSGSRAIRSLAADDLACLIRSTRINELVTQFSAASQSIRPDQASDAVGEHRVEITGWVDGRHVTQNDRPREPWE